MPALHVEDIERRLSSVASVAVKRRLRELDGWQGANLRACGTVLKQCVTYARVRVDAQ